eukprot:6459143-Amphidinium_carterae.3
MQTLPARLEDSDVLLSARPHGVVQVLSAANLSSPEYRLGDLTTGWMRKQFQNVYVELQMGDKA